MKLFSGYLDTLSRLNDLGKGMPVHFLFHMGMLFSSPDKWWGDFKKRASIHEGIDITYYRDARGNHGRFDHRIRVPVMRSGIILNICNDFLGQSIVIEPFQPEKTADGREIDVYAHITPMPHAHLNAVVLENETMATVCPTDKNPAMPPHLHFSCCEVPRSIQPDRLNWDLFSKGTDVCLIHPVFL